MDIKLPLFLGFDLTYFQVISAIDYDISGYEINFESNDTEIIQVGTLRNENSEDRKRRYATLILTQQLLSLPNPIEFTITARVSYFQFKVN